MVTVTFRNFILNEHLYKILRLDKDMNTTKVSFERWLDKRDMIYICNVCPEGIQPYNMKNRDIYWRRHMIQETLCIG